MGSDLDNIANAVSNGAGREMLWAALRNVYFRDAENNVEAWAQLTAWASARGIRASRYTALNARGTEDVWVRFTQLPDA